MIKSHIDFPQQPSLKWQYPALAKPDSDGIFCYFVQRRISCYVSNFCANHGISPNQATLIDLFFAILATICVYFQLFFLGVICIQLFGIWSCVDGEVARFTETKSKLGDYYDTMVDRVAELMITMAFFFVVKKYSNTNLTELTFFLYLGAIFLITVSSEKYRSSYQQNYPKKKVEFLFCWITAGSDTRFLYLSAGIIGWAMTGKIVIVNILIGILSLLLFLNFVYRMRVIYLLSLSEKVNKPVSIEFPRKPLLESNLNAFVNDANCIEKTL
jgi:phosphatidylglycerophosphate synthase